MGYALLRCRGKEAVVLASGVLRLAPYGDHYRRLTAIYQRINQVISEYRPDELAIEAPFFGKNVQSMLKLGRAQGVAMAAALMRGMPVQEYSPRRIKQVITGNGNASKEQVARMLPMLVVMPPHLETHDETEALATALCQHMERQSPFGPGALKRGRVTKSSRGRKTGGWEDFLAENPDRIAP